MPDVKTSFFAVLLVRSAEANDWKGPVQMGVEIVHFLRVWEG